MEHYYFSFLSAIKICYLSDKIEKVILQNSGQLTKV